MYTGGMRKKMGTFYVDFEVVHHNHRDRRTEVHKALVDTGSEATWIAAETLRKIGVIPEKKDMTFVMTNGQIITRQIGFAIIRIGGQMTTDEVVFALTGDLQILGARTLEGLNLTVHPRKKMLVAAGPRLAAVLA